MTLDPELLAALKALAEPRRLRILGSLADGRPRSAEALANGLELAPATVAHHLRRLRLAGLVTVIGRPPQERHELRPDRLASIGRELDRLGREAPDGDGESTHPEGRELGAFEAKVLRAFLVDGRLERIPAQQRKRQVILRFLAATDFRPGEEVPERDVNMRLALRHRDVAALRRCLVDDGYMERGGGIYRVLPEDRWPPRGPMPEG